MCGISGLFALDGKALSDPDVVAGTMANTMEHRGPDAGGTWGDAEAGIGLGHRRLAIVDLSASGKQPMHSSDGRFVITYNGEVYNFQELRRELASLGHVFNGTSDTEVMLTAFVQWGVLNAVKRFVGMFAFAVFDRSERALYLVRDRIGVKPLYWTNSAGTVLFASELRALIAHPQFRREINREAVATMMAYSYIPAPATIFKDVFKLPSGSVLVFRRGQQPELCRYWNIEDIAARQGQSRIDLADAVSSLDALLRDAISKRMIADVPVGAFLSGGVDSSAVVAIMQATAAAPVNTFTIGIDNAVYDESAAARRVAHHLGTNHTEVILGEQDLLGLVPSIPDWFDEPFADASQLPTYLVSRITRQHVTVALSGDGGDELFAGYPKYVWLDRIWRQAGGIPRPLRVLMGRILMSTPERALNIAARAALDPERAERIGEKVRRVGLALQARNFDHAAAAIAQVATHDLLADRAASHADFPVLASLPDDLDRISRMQAHDLATYLPDDILTKVDRCSMAVSLEAREPLLDHRVIEFLWSLPSNIRRLDSSKGLLRAVLARYVPISWMDRPKRGFSVPLADWLRGPLRDWAAATLDPARTARQGFLDPTLVDAMWQGHLNGRENNATALWNALMLSCWSERWLRSS